MFQNVVKVAISLFPWISKCYYNNSWPKRHAWVLFFRDKLTDYELYRITANYIIIGCYNCSSVVTETSSPVFDSLFPLYDINCGYYLNFISPLPIDFTVGQVVGIAIGAFLLCLLITVLPIICCCCCLCGIGCLASSK